MILGRATENKHIFYFGFRPFMEDLTMLTLILKARCWKPPGHYLCIPEPGRPDCVISIEIGVNGDTYPVAISPKVTKNLPVSFYSPTSGFKGRLLTPRPQVLCGGASN